MKWKDATLLSFVSEERDELNNPIPKEIIVGNVKCRFTPWNKEELALEDRNITSTTRKLLLRLSMSKFPKCERVRMLETYDIKKVVDLERFVLLHVKEIK
ncbi:MAG: hypothetical protein RR441_08145 [Longicatena sp.]